MPEAGSEEVLLVPDGAVSGNPGAGGWAVVLGKGEHQKELSGGEPHTTNNRMELRAVIEGLNALTRPCRVRRARDDDRRRLVAANCPHRAAEEDGGSG